MASRRKKAKHSAAKPRPTPSALKLALQERDEALRFQAATAEILVSLSRSSADARPVFDAIVANVLKLFGTRYAAVFVVKGDELHLAASGGDTKLEKTRAAAFKKFRTSFPQRIDWSGFTGKALRAGKVSQIAPIIGNPKATPQAVQLARDFGYNAMLVAPLMKDGKAIGAIGTTRPEGEPFAREQLALFEAFASQAVIAIENARLFNETKASLAQQTALGEVLRIVSRTVTDAQPAIDAILGVVLRLFPTFDATVWLVRDRHLVPVARGGPTAGRAPGQRVPVTRDYFHGWVILNRRPYSIDNVAVSRELSEVSRADLLSRERRAILMVPLVRQGEAVGAISVSRAEPYPFSPRQVALLGNFADQAVIAIENARLFNETKEALERQTATSEILKVIAGSPADVKPVFDAILRSAVTLCGAELAAVFPFDGKLVHMTATHNWPQAALDYFSKVYPSPPNPRLLSGRTILNRTVVQIPDAAVDEHYDPSSAATGHWRRMIGVPMLREGRPLGAMVVAWRDPGEAPPGQVELLQTFADQAAIAVENVRLFNETKEALERQTATAGILRVIAASPTNVQPVLDTVAESASRLCGSTNVTVLLRDGEVLRTLATFSGEEGPTPPATHEVPVRRTFVTGRAVLEGCTVHVEDLLPILDTEYPEARDNQRRFGFRSVLAVPMMREGSAIGVIYAWRRHAGPFAAEQVSLLQTFADQAVIAIENVRLFNETKEALDQQKASAEVLGAISGSIADTKPVFDKILSSCERLFEGELVGITRTEGETVDLVAYHGPEGERLKQVYPLPLTSESGTGWAILNAQIAHFPDIESSGVPPGVVAGCRALRVRAIVFAPMLFEGKGIGAIWVARAQPVAFTDKQIVQLRTFADQAVIAIQNARLVNETTEALDQQRATAQVLQTISRSAFELQTVLDTLVQNAARLIGVPSGQILRRHGSDLRIAAVYAVDPRERAFWEQWTIAVGSPVLAGIVAATKKPLAGTYRADDPAARETTPEARAYLQRFGMTSALAVPLLKDEEVIGVLHVGGHEERRFTKREFELLQTFADQAVIAIENVRLFNETKEALEKQTATSDILQVLSESPSDTQPVFDAIVRHAARLCESSYANVFRYDGERLHLAASHGGTPVALAALRSSYPAPPERKRAVGRAIQTGRAIRIEDTLADAEYDRGFAAKLLVRRLLAVPLLRAGQATGAITVGWAEPGPIRERHEDLLRTFADQAVIAIENVRLFNETKEALERQTAISEILEKIAGSPTDVAPVLQAVAERAARLCEAEQTTVLMVEGDMLKPMVTYSKDQGPLPNPETLVRLDRGYLAGRAALDGAVVNVDDAVARLDEFPLTRENQKRLGYRSFLAAPMMRQGRAIGVIAVWRRAVRPFSDKHEALTRTFADQAAIAIENVRLFNETKEALDQQKASAEVLGAISGSIADTQPVFDKILESCMRLFDGHQAGVIVVRNDGLAEVAASHGDKAGELLPVPVTHESATGRAVLSRQVLHYPDIVSGPDIPPLLKPNAAKFGIKSGLFAPMVWEGKGIGCVYVGRQERGAFSEKAIRLLKTFADQAVIAIQNVRLFREIQDKSAQLEVANKHKSDFLANMSHELRTPLNAIIGFSEVLSERMFGEVNEKQAEYLKDIHESGRHLLSLINDILDLSKIEAGRMELELSTFDLPAAVSNAMTLVRERAQRHGIYLGIEMDPRLGAFQADERKVKQILLNLLSNAVKFTPDGGRVEVRAKMDTDKVEIAVKDTGIGIAAEDHAAVFEEFKQVGRDYTRKAEGTGLGLALTKRLVELHGGEIALESAPGKGSTFTVKLPLR